MQVKPGFWTIGERTDFWIPLGGLQVFRVWGSLPLVAGFWAHPTPQRVTLASGFRSETGAPPGDPSGPRFQQPRAAFH